MMEWCIAVVLLRLFDFLRWNFGPHLLFGKLLCWLVHTHTFTGWCESISFHRSTCHIFAVAAAFRAKQIDSKFTVPNENFKFQVKNIAFLFDGR